jgi:hypothetical protein
MSDGQLMTVSRFSLVNKNCKTCRRAASWAFNSRASESSLAADMSETHAAPGSLVLGDPIRDFIKRKHSSQGGKSSCNAGAGY